MNYLIGRQSKRYITIRIYPFHATGLFRYPLKTSENQRFARFSDIFRGYRKRPWHEMGKLIFEFLHLKILYIILPFPKFRTHLPSRQLHVQS